MERLAKVKQAADGAAAHEFKDRRKSQRLRESEERFRLIVENTVDYAIFMLDPQGRIVSWNVGAERIKGYSADEIIGKHFSVFYTDEAKQREWPQHELREAERVGRFEDEGWRVRKDGSRFWANVVITALRGPRGELRGFGKVTRDVSERRAQLDRIETLSRQLQQRVDELDTTNRELVQKTSENESFVYSVSHDLRTPLVNLQGFSQELSLTTVDLGALLSDARIPVDIRERAATLLSTDIGESLSFIRNAVQHLSNIIDGLLRLSRVGRVEYRNELVNLNAVVADIVAAMRASVTAAGAMVTVGDLPAVHGDRNAIGQIFANLLGNALKALDRARPGQIQISASQDAPPVFSVTDNGIGIPEEYRPKIFQVFQRVHDTPGPGEGMGLAIVRRIVERHGGRIWFQSTPGAGTTFFFTLAPRSVLP